MRKEEPLAEKKTCEENISNNQNTICSCSNDLLFSDLPLEQKENQTSPAARSTHPVLLKDDTSKKKHRQETCGLTQSGKK
jgi:hypothetical protein